MHADLRLLRAMRRRGHHPAIERAALEYSRLGEHSRLWFSIAAAGAIADRRQRPIYARLARALVVVEVTNAVAKRVVRRRRPRLDGLPPLTPTQSELSFPSAHAATSFAAARILTGTQPAIAVYGMAAAMALSRPYLGVHYPSDVLAGALLGTALIELVP
jgi:membrane-associated phospholipid phosphatase